MKESICRCAIIFLIVLNSGLNLCGQSNYISVSGGIGGGLTFPKIVEENSETNLIRYSGFNQDVYLEFYIAASYDRWHYRVGIQNHFRNYLYGSSSGITSFSLNPGYRVIKSDKFSLMPEIGFGYFSIRKAEPMSTLSTLTTDTDTAYSRGNYSFYDIEGEHYFNIQLGITASFIVSPRSNLDLRLNFTKGFKSFERAELEYWHNRKGTDYLILENRGDILGLSLNYVYKFGLKNQNNQ